MAWTKGEPNPLGCVLKQPVQVDPLVLSLVDFQGMRCSIWTPKAVSVEKLLRFSYSISNSQVLPIHPLPGWSTSCQKAETVHGGKPSIEDASRPPSQHFHLKLRCTFSFIHQMPPLHRLSKSLAVTVAGREFCALAELIISARRTGLSYRYTVSQIGIANSDPRRCDLSRPDDGTRCVA